MKNKLLIFILGFAIIIFLLAMDKCGNSLKYNNLRTEYNTLERMFKASAEISKEIIAEKEKEIAVADKKIKELESKIVAQNEAIAHLDNTIADVESAYDEEASPAMQIANLKQQVQLWKNKFQLAESIIADKDKIIFSLTQKYEAQLSITHEWELKYDGAIKLNDNLNLQVKALKGQVNRLKIGSGTKNLLIVIAGGIIIYGLVK